MEETSPRARRRTRSCDISEKNSSTLITLGEEDFHSLATDLRKSSIHYRLQQLAKLKAAMKEYDEEEWFDACSTHMSSESECDSFPAALEAADASESTGSIKAFPSDSSLATDYAVEEDTASNPSHGDYAIKEEEDDSLTWQKVSPVAVEHVNGTCKPCLYFHFKSDGCR